MSPNYRELPPPPDLAAWVRCRWVSGGRRSGPGWVVPDGCLDLIWLDGDLIVAGPDDVPHPHGAQAEPRSSDVVGVRFRPGRAGPLLRETPSQLRNQRVAYSALGPSAVDRLAERVADADRPAEILHLLVAEVRARAVAATEADAVGTGCAELLEASGGRLTVADVAGELGVSERHLRRRATEALGYGPKTFARIVRFQRALGLLQAGQSPATTAAAAGYADQAHLTREVSALAARPPGELRQAADPGRFVQDPDGDAAVR